MEWCMYLNKNGFYFIPIDHDASFFSFFFLVSGVGWGGGGGCYLIPQQRHLPTVHAPCFGFE